MSDNLPGRLPTGCIAGQDFTPEQIECAVRESRLLTIELEMTYACNLSCAYCYASAGKKRPAEMSQAEISCVLAQARSLGAVKVVLLGGGEPLLYEDFRSLVDEIKGLGMDVSVFTNGTLVDGSAARFFYEREVSVVVKRNSAIPAVQDRLTGRPGTAALIERAFENLFAAGYPSQRHVLGAQTVICRANLDEIEELWRWARDRGVQPYFECMTMQGRALDGGLETTPEEYRGVFERLSRIDREEYGMISWEPRPPLAGATCRRLLYSILVKANGCISPCVGVDLAVGNIRRDALRDVIEKSPVIRNLRNVYALLKGPCADCRHAGQCYGCRGNAYQITGDCFASDPGCWIAQDNLARADGADEEAKGPSYIVQR